jgi:hypothetical protein
LQPARNLEQLYSLLCPYEQAVRHDITLEQSDIAGQNDPMLGLCRPGKSGMRATVTKRWRRGRKSFSSA